MASNRAAIWVLVGVVVGFGMPVLALIGLVLVLAVSTSQLAGQAAPSLEHSTHLSGPATGPAVAVVDVSGPIFSGRAELLEAARVAASGDIVPVIRRAAEVASVKALVVRVNSPGGSVVGSDEIYDALRQTDKPVVALMSEVAASGGYYISMAAEHIVANPNTLTGSIGVIGQFPNLTELMDKVGVEVTTIKSGKSKDLGNPFRDMTGEERAIFQGIVDETYAHFVGIVSAGRGLPEERVRELADGRVYTGEKAMELGLVDALGYERDAIAKAAELGGIEGEPRVVRFKRKSGVFEMLMGSAGPVLSGLPGVSRDWVARLLAPSLEYRWKP